MSIRPLIYDTVAAALREDLLPLGDLTSHLIPEAKQVRAAFVARQRGVISGVCVVEEVIRQVDLDLKLQVSIQEGQRVEKGDQIAEVTGKLKSVVTFERTALNFLSHLSGVASYTNLFVEKVKSVSDITKVLDTRKTTPGLRMLEKAAVRAGGGSNHRGSLSDAVMIKDTHLVGLDIQTAVSKARSLWPGRFVEVECETISQVLQAAEAGSDIVMFDNMALLEAKEAKDELEVFARTKGSRPLIEISGGVTMENIADYAALGVDFISLGIITNSAPSLDIGLDII